MNEQGKKLFEDAGINPDDAPAVLGLILAAPMAVSANIGMADTIRVALEAALKMDPAEVRKFLDYQPDNGLGVIVDREPPKLPPMKMPPKLRAVRRIEPYL